LLDHWSDRDGQHHTVIEFADGGTLSSYLAHRIKEGTWNATAALPMLAGVAEGLAFVHARGFVHRDVKPAKMLVLTHGPRALLSGFDAACAAADAETKPVGTWLYMAPEVADGGACTPASDVWSLGIAAFELLAADVTSQPWPFAPYGSLRGLGSPAAEQLADAAKEREPVWSALRADVPAGVRVLLGRMLARDAGTRPTAVQVVEELLKLAGGE